MQLACTQPMTNAWSSLLDTIKMVISAWLLLNFQTHFWLRIPITLPWSIEEVAIMCLGLLREMMYSCLILPLSSKQSGELTLELKMFRNHWDRAWIPIQASTRLKLLTLSIAMIVDQLLLMKCWGCLSPEASLLATNKRSNSLVNLTNREKEEWPLKNFRMRQEIEAQSEDETVWN